MTRLTPHVVFALRRAHGHAQRELADAHLRLQRTEEAVGNARECLAAATAEEAELRAALDAHVDATTAESAQAAQAAVVDDSRRPRESWEH